MRVVALLLCLTLTACLTSKEPNPGADQSAPPTAAPTAATPPASGTPPAASAPPPRRSAPQALRGAAPPPAPSPEPEPEVVTDPVLEARQICWSQGNKNRALTLEARADWVNKCIADKTKAMGQ